jgi:uncharacterized protein (TIGR02147 family)
METHRLLKKYFDHKKKSVHGFSLRFLAKRLDVSPSFLSRVLNGQKSIPHSLLIPLGLALDISPEVFAQVKDSRQIIIPIKGKTPIRTETEDWVLAGETSSRLLTQWFYIPILELFGLKNFDGSIAQISERLSISKESVAVAVRELISLGCLQEIEKGRLTKTNRKLRFSSSRSKSEIRSFHSQMLQKAKDELKNKTSEEDFEKRLITGITLTAPKEKIEEVKRKLSECLHEIANELTAEAGDEVYHLSAQLFPLTYKK